MQPDSWTQLEAVCALACRLHNAFTAAGVLAYLIEQKYTQRTPCAYLSVRIVQALASRVCGNLAGSEALGAGAEGDDSRWCGRCGIRQDDTREHRPFCLLRLSRLRKRRILPMHERSSWEEEEEEEEEEPRERLVSQQAGRASRM